MTEQELLAVLDMSEDEQRIKIAKCLSPKPFKHDWLYENAVGGLDNIATGEAWACRKCGHEEIYKRTPVPTGQFIPAVLDKQTGDCGIPDPITESLADLAFRLRDEVENIDDMLSAIYKVQRRLKKNNKESKLIGYAEAVWFAFYAKPIHWIIAALIAKGKSNV